MKTIILSISILSVLLLNSGCSNTWQGVKKDSSSAWKKTKETIHEATE
ncbi:MAG: entericidin EcnAB [Sulfurimonas sp.]|nr:entericidin EcnAB [Sulfurimonas sp.]